MMNSDAAWYLSTMAQWAFGTVVLTVFFLVMDAFFCGGKGRKENREDEGMQWEYTVRTIQDPLFASDAGVTGTEKEQELLEKMADHGWELLQVLRLSGVTTYYWKRPRIDAHA
jgi:hypothetical protein